MTAALSFIRDHPGRYAITGVPCFIKAIRLLCRQESVFAERIRFCMGMFCGHFKSAAYAESLAWQMGIPPDDLLSLDFRGKIPGKPANVKGIFARSKPNPEQTVGPAITRELFGGGYNLGFFQYKACDYCDDVVAETADVAIGDAWLPEFIQDEKGTSIVIVRNREIGALIEAGIAEGRLALQPISAKKVIESQLGGFKHRREGLAYRLELSDQRGEWRPQKRVQAGSKGLSRKRKEIYRLRIAMREKSHAAFRAARESGDLQQFIAEMSPLVETYQAHYRPGQLHRIKRALQRRWKRLKGWVGSRT
jgi:coenzyme F420-reducing hydrogenase beta subunit